VPVPLHQEAANGAEEQLHRVPPRNSYSAEYYWRPHQRNRSNDDEDDDDADGRGGRAFTRQRHSLFQLLRWPSDKGCGRERSPWRSHGENSHHDGHQSLSLATHRSRLQRAFSRPFHPSFTRREKASKEVGAEHTKNKRPRGHCKPTHPSPWDKPGAGSTGTTCTPLAGNEVELSAMIRTPDAVSTIDSFDPCYRKSQS
jgi:hypothetical protein